MSSIACEGDKLSSGGFIASGSDTMTILGRRVARVGDLVSCPLPGHGVNQLIEGSNMVTDNGKAVVMHGHRAACGCFVLAYGDHGVVL